MDSQRYLGYTAQHYYFILENGVGILAFLFCSILGCIHPSSFPSLLRLRCVATAKRHDSYDMINGPFPLISHSLV